MKKNSRFIRTIGLLVLCIFILSGCGGPKPDAVVTSFLTAMQETDYATAATYVDGATNTEGKTIEFDNALEEQLMTAIMRNIAFENVETQSSEDGKAIVKVTLTTLDSVTIMHNVMSDVMGSALAYAFSDVSEEQLDKMTETLIVNAFSAPDAPRVKKDVTVNLVKADGGWKVVADDALFDKLTGGLDSYFSEDESSVSNDVTTTDAPVYDATNDYVFSFLGESVNNIYSMIEADGDYTNFGFYEGGIAIQFEQDASPYIFIVTPYDTASDTVYGTDEVAAVLITEAGVEINEEIQSGMTYSQIANAVKRGACSDLEYDDMNECYSAAVKYPFYEVLYSFESEDSNAMDVLIKKQ